MSKTYRNAPVNYADYGKSRHIKKIDKKHQNVLVNDGVYGSDTSTDFVSDGEKTIRKDWKNDGNFSQASKKSDKRLKSKFERRHIDFQKEIEEENGERDL